MNKQQQYSSKQENLQFGYEKEGFKNETYKRSKKCKWEFVPSCLVRKSTKIQQPST